MAISSGDAVSLRAEKGRRPCAASAADNRDPASLARVGAARLCATPYEGAEALIVMVMAGKNEVDMERLKAWLEPVSPSMLIAPMATARPERVMHQDEAKVCGVLFEIFSQQVELASHGDRWRFCIDRDHLERAERVTAQRVWVKKLTKVRAAVVVAPHHKRRDLRPTRDEALPLKLVTPPLDEVTQVEEVRWRVGFGRL